MGDKLTPETLRTVHVLITDIPYSVSNALGKTLETYADAWKADLKNMSEERETRIRFGVERQDALDKVRRLEAERTALLGKLEHWKRLAQYGLSAYEHIRLIFLDDVVDVHKRSDALAAYEKEFGDARPE